MPDAEYEKLQKYRKWIKGRCKKEDKNLGHCTNWAEAGIKSGGKLSFDTLQKMFADMDARRKKARRAWDAYLKAHASLVATWFANVDKMTREDLIALRGAIAGQCEAVMRANAKLKILVEEWADAQIAADKEIDRLTKALGGLEKAQKEYQKLATGQNDWVKKQERKFSDYGMKPTDVSQILLGNMAVKSKRTEIDIARKTCNAHGKEIAGVWKNLEAYLASIRAFKSELLKQKL